MREGIEQWAKSREVEQGKEKCSGKEVYFPTKHGNLSPCKGYKKTRRFQNRFCLYNKVIQCKSSGNDEGSISIGLTSSKKRATFPIKKGT